MGVSCGVSWRFSLHWILAMNQQMRRSANMVDEPVQIGMHKTVQLLRYAAIQGHICNWFIATLFESSLTNRTLPGGGISPGKKERFDKMGRWPTVDLDSKHIFFAPKKWYPWKLPKAKNNPWMYSNTPRNETCLSYPMFHGMVHSPVPKCCMRQTFGYAW